MKPILAIIRKSPTPTPEESLALQRSKILERINADISSGVISSGKIVWAEDICKGDDEEGRVNLNKHLKHIEDFQCAYCLNVDRFSRSWLGLKWLHKYFDEGVQIKFLQGIDNLYDDEGRLKPDMYLFFFIQCGFAHYELLNIRRRTTAGRDKIRGTSEWKKKYKGRPKGSKDSKKRKTTGYTTRWNNENK